MYFFIEKKISKKSSKEYFELYADLDYKIQSITFDKAIICALLDITERELHDIPVETPIKIGSIFDDIDYSGE